MIGVRVPSLITNTDPCVDESDSRISLPGPSSMKRGRSVVNDMNSSTAKPAGTSSLAASGLGTTVALLRADGVANGAGSSFQFTGLRPDCAASPRPRTVVSTAARATVALVMILPLWPDRRGGSTFARENEDRQHDGKEDLPAAEGILPGNAPGRSVDEHLKRLRPERVGQQPNRHEDVLEG